VGHFFQATLDILSFRNVADDKEECFIGFGKGSNFYEDTSPWILQIISEYVTTACGMIVKGS
jgi:hypothetical protein